MADPKKEWTPDTIHLEYMVAKVDPDFVSRQGRMRYDKEACKAIDKNPTWYTRQPREFKKWLTAEIGGVIAYSLPRAWNNLMEIASGEKKGARAGEQVSAIKLMMERFDPDFKRDKNVQLTVKSIHEIVKEADADPYTTPQYDFDNLPQEELPAPEQDELRDDAIQALVGDEVA